MKRKELIEKWLKALESGKYKQGDTYLIQKGRKENKYCCLGVLCEVYGSDMGRLMKNETSCLPNTVANKVGMGLLGDFTNPVYYRGHKYQTLAMMNDFGISFKTIAKIIRENLEEGNL